MLPLPAVVLIVLIVLWGCSSLPPAPQRERIILTTSRSTQYYSVRGVTTDAIFDDIERNGLFDHNARRAVGLTSADWGIDWKGIETRPGLCGPESMTITMKLVVTLPRHDQLNDLSQHITTNWQRFSARVAAHEQRHVDIYLTGAKKMKTRMEAILTQMSSCSELTRMIHSIWASEQADTESAQEEFHLEDEAKSQNDRKPLQAQIDINQGRLTAIDSELRGLDQALGGSKGQHETTQAEIDAIKSEMAKVGVSPSSCSQSGLTTRAQALCHDYNRLAQVFNGLVKQHNEIVSRRNVLADEYNRVSGVTNSLIETLNWTQ